MDTSTANSIIDSALLNAQTGTDSGTGTSPNESGVLPGPLPSDDTVVDESTLTPEQKQARDEQEKIRKAREDMLGEEAAKAQEEEERKQAEREKTLIGIGEKLLNQSKATATGAGVKIANIPTPGNITVPLTLLVIFFIALITYAGHTRLQWIWLVLTSNAYVGAQGTATGSGGPMTAIDSLPAATVTTTPLLTPVALPANGMIGDNPYS